MAAVGTCALAERASSTCRTIAASTAPIGSLTIASHLSSDAARCCNRFWRSNGRTTVGPVTITMAPNSTAAAQLIGVIACAASVPKRQVMATAAVVSRNTPPPAARSSRTSRVRPPSNTTVATARSAIGRKLRTKLPAWVRGSEGPVRTGGRRRTAAQSPASGSAS